MATSPEVRGTQSLVHTLADCWRRPSLLALEVAWRWLFGIPALWLLYREGTRILAAAPLESTGILQFSLQDPWKAAVVLSDTWAVLQPLILKTAIWLVPLLAIAWASPLRPWPFAGTATLRSFVAVGSVLPHRAYRCCAWWLWVAVFAAWFYGIHSGSERDARWLGRAQSAALPGYRHLPHPGIVHALVAGKLGALYCAAAGAAGAQVSPIQPVAQLPAWAHVQGQANGSEPGAGHR